MRTEISNDYPQQLTHYQGECWICDILFYFVENLNGNLSFSFRDYNGSVQCNTFSDADKNISNPRALSNSQTSSLEESLALFRWRLLWWQSETGWVSLATKVFTSVHISFPASLVLSSQMLQSHTRTHICRQRRRFITTLLTSFTLLWLYHIGPICSVRLLFISFLCSLWQSWTHSLDLTSA